MMTAVQAIGTLPANAPSPKWTECTEITKELTELQKTKMVIRKRVEGQVSFNNGEFVEVEINGTEGVEKGLFLETIQISSEEANMTCSEFRRKFPVGTLLDVSTTTEITARAPLP